jgi:hypothetical protein
MEVPDIDKPLVYYHKDHHKVLEYRPRAGSYKKAGNTEGGSITVPLSSCLTGLDWFVLQTKTKIVSCHTADSKLVKQEVNSTVILPPLVFPAKNHTDLSSLWCFIVRMIPIYCDPFVKIRYHNLCYVRFFSGNSLNRFGMYQWWKGFN